MIYNNERLNNSIKYDRWVLKIKIWKFKKNIVNEKWEMRMRNENEKWEWEMSNENDNEVMN